MNIKVIKIKRSGNYGIGTTTPSSFIQLNAKSLGDAWGKLIRFTLWAVKNFILSIKFKLHYEKETT